MHAARPVNLSELKERARALAGRTVAEVAQTFLASGLKGPALHRKGKLGQLVERVLGASAGARAEPDFPELGVELKTIPLGADGRARESTFVASFSLADADSADWGTSAVRRKLQHVLWVPVLVDEPQVRFGEPLFWQPTRQQEQILRADFDDIMGVVALGQVETLTANLSAWLQARPKAAHSRVRTLAFGEDGPALALPRGFYLRARVTSCLLRDATTLAGC